ncbi:MAG: hypothetical protein ACI85U_002133 [Candidatus Promineifilaceae bacterium]|jgi:hypothetical protein
MAQTTRNNHFVPQFYLQQWSMDSQKIWEYPILVSHKNVPDWSLKSIRNVAFQRDLYTQFEDGIEIDEFENWLKQEFEDPVQESLKKVLKDDPLTSNDWNLLVGFLASQDLRTPTSYINLMKMRSELQTSLQSTLEDSVRRMEDSIHNKNELPPHADIDDSLFDDSLKVEITADPGSSQRFIGVNLTLGRRFWLEQQKHMMNKIGVLKDHKWSVYRPARGLDWFTSDHPVVKLNYYAGGKYDLKGGWARKGGNIFMPLSPRHLLFTEVGGDLPDTKKLSPKMTRELQAFLAERGRKSIYSHKKLPIIKKLRPRTVDSEVYKLEEAQLQNWHDQQSKFDNI